MTIDWRNVAKNVIACVAIFSIQFLAVKLALLPQSLDPVIITDATVGREKPLYNINCANVEKCKEQFDNLCPGGWVATRDGTTSVWLNCR